MPIYNVSKQSNTNYKTLLSVPSAGIQIIMDTPEQFMYSVQSSWEQTLPGLFTAIQNARDATLGAQGAGIGFIHKEETRSIYAGTTPITIPLTILFDAITDAYNDVYVPLNTLAAIASPEEKGDMLYAPGPTRADSTTNAVTLSVGRIWTMEDGILESAQVTFDTRYDSKGYPISGQAEISVKGSVTTSRQDFMSKGMIPSSTFGGS